MVPTMDMMAIPTLHTTHRLMYFVVVNITGNFLIELIIIVKLNSCEKFQNTP